MAFRDVQISSALMTDGTDNDMKRAIMLDNQGIVPMTFESWYSGLILSWLDDLVSSNQVNAYFPIILDDWAHVSSSWTIVSRGSNLLYLRGYTGPHFARA